MKGGGRSQVLFPPDWLSHTYVSALLYGALLSAIYLPLHPYRLKPIQLGMKSSLLKRLTLTFVVYLGVLLGMSMLMLSMSTKVGSLTTEIYQIDYQKKEVTDRLIENLISVEETTKKYILLQDQAYLPRIMDRAKDIAEEWAFLCLPRIPYDAQEALVLKRSRLQWEDFLACFNNQSLNLPQASQSRERISVANSKEIDEMVRVVKSSNHRAMLALDHKMIYLQGLGDEIVVFTGWAFGTALFIGLIVLLIIYHGITRDIGSIKGGIKHLADGDFSYKIPIASTDELGLLAQSFNTIGKHLKELDDRKKREAFELFRTCIQAYHDKNLPLLALAAAKAARSSLGIDPRLQAHLIRLYTAAGLLGNADKEFHSSLAHLGLDKITLFQGLNREEILAMLEVMEIQSIPKGKPVFRQGEKGADIFIIHTGRFEVVRDNQRLRVMLPGGIFGELGFFHHSTRSATVRALDQGTFLRLDALNLKPICDRHPAILQAFETLYTERLIRKEGEDIQVVLDELSSTTEVCVPKGTEISPFDGITIVKHGVVEVKTDELGLAKKNFMGPGKILNFSRGRATASTDVRLIKARCELKELQPAKP